MTTGPGVRLRMTMASESWAFGEFKLTHIPSKIGTPWTTNLRTTIRSFLSKLSTQNIVVSADMALCRLIARMFTAARRLGELLIRLKGTIRSQFDDSPAMR